MKFLVVLLAAVACQAAPQWTPYNVVQGAPVIAHAQSMSPAVMKIPKPGIRFNVPAPVSYAAPVQAAAPAPVSYVAPAPAPVSYVAPAPAPVSYVAPAPAPVSYVAPAPVPVSAPVQVATPVHYTAAATPVVAASPVVVAAAPEPLQAPEPPMPSVGTPFVGGQFHAQDEAGQYTFGHWGGPNTRVETKDYLGRTSGSFAYVDPIGDVQVRKYASSPVSGFRVAASDLPDDTYDTPIIAQAKAAHAQAHADAAAAAVSIV